MATENVNTRTKYAVEIKEYNTTDQSTGNMQKTFAQSSNAGEILVSVSLNQEMYKPSCLEIVIQTNSSSISDFKDKLVSLYIYVPTTGEIILSESNKIVSNYYIFNIKKKGEYITLIAYSPDYFLTLDKFCQAFTAKKMVEEIITSTLKNIETENFDKFRNIIKKDNGELPIINKVRNFLISDPQKAEDANDKYTESMLPYAVQYNESFYDFMVRMCNRDGEFLYMDKDNSLCVGLDDENERIVDLPLDAEIEFINSYETLDNSNWVDLDYLDQQKTEESKETNSSDEKNIKIKSNCYVLAPEYLENLEDRGNYAEWGDYTCWFTGVNNFLHALENERTISDSVVSASVQESVTNGHIGYFVNKTNKNYQNVYGNTKLLYSNGNRTNDIYKKIYNNQIWALSNKVRVVTGEIPSVNLGEIIKFTNEKNENYVVYSTSTKIIGEKDATNKINYFYEYEILLVKRKYDEESSKFVSYPLPIPNKRIRTASAQRAIVVGNFDPSRLGRVRIKYPWQQDDTQDFSPWIRVATPMASDGAGFLFTPAVNDEVLVDYEDGNIERPYVCGAFYNSTNRPSIPSQSQTSGLVKSITSANGHHISFTDNGGVERYMSNIMPIAKFINSFGLSDQKTFDGPNAKYFGGGFEIADFYGIYSITGSTHNRSISINSPFGDVSINAFSGITINAPLGDVKIVGKNVSIEARNNLTIQSGTNISGYFANKENLNIPLSFLGVANKVAMIDFSVLRTYLDVMLRPIGGTMLIKSNRYMRLEAGEGNASPDESIKGATNKLTSPINQQNSTLSQEKDRALRAYGRFFIWAKTYNDRIDAVDRRISDKSFIENGNVRTSDSIISELSQDGSGELANDSEIQANIILTVRNLNLLMGMKDRLNLDGVNGFPNIDENWRRFEKVKIPSAKKIVYNHLKEVVMRNESLRSKVMVEPLPNDDFPSNLSKYVTSPDNTDVVVGKVITKLSGMEGFLSEDRNWETSDKGAILFSDNKELFYKIGSDGQFLQGQNIDHVDEFIRLVNSVEEII